MMTKKEKKRKEVKNRQLILQVKKERLEVHLEYVEQLIEGWILQLSASDPFASYTRGESWGWKSAYEPDSEQDPDSNHVLRKHLRSRALWRHHADWRWRLGRVFEMSANVRMKANQVCHEGRAVDGSSAEVRPQTEGCLGTALWQAFALARKLTPNVDYVRGDDGKGVKFGGHVIDTSSASNRKFEEVCKRHRSLSLELSCLDEMKTLAEEWASVEELQNAMQLIANKALKSSDFLYPCTFCKRLWSG